MALVTNTEVNSAQIATLLATINNVGSTLSELENAYDTETARLGDDPRNPLESSLLNACERLDKILNDDSRWELPARDGHQSYQGIATQQEKCLILTNALKEREVFTAELNKQLSLRRFHGLLATSPTPKKRTHVKRKE